LDDFFEKHLSGLSFDLVGISVVARDQLFYALAFVSYLKRRRKEAKIAIGGSFITLNRREVLNFFSKYPVIDFFIIGEGETAIFRLASGDKKYINIPNLYFWDGRKYKKSKAKRQEMINELPAPNFEKEDIGHNSREDEIIFLQATRLCFWNKCAFCLFPNLSTRFCIRSAEKIIEDVKKINAALGRKDLLFHFCDNALPPPFIKEFSRMVIEQRIPAWKFRAFTRFDARLDEETLNLAKRAKFEFVFGLESSVKRVSKLINKGVNLDKVNEIIRICDKLRIPILIALIFGFPTETKDEVLQEIKFIKNLKRYKRTKIEISINWFRLERDSDIYLSPKKFNIKVEKQVVPFCTIHYFKDLTPGALSFNRDSQFFAEELKKIKTSKRFRINYLDELYPLKI